MEGVGCAASPEPAPAARPGDDLQDAGRRWELRSQSARYVRCCTPGGRGAACQDRGGRCARNVATARGGRPLGPSQRRRQRRCARRQALALLRPATSSKQLPQPSWAAFFLLVAGSGAGVNNPSRAQPPTACSATTASAAACSARDPTCFDLGAMLLTYSRGVATPPAGVKAQVWHIGLSKEARPGGEVSRVGTDAARGACGTEAVVRMAEGEGKGAGRVARIRYGAQRWGGHEEGKSCPRKEERISESSSVHLDHAALSHAALKHGQRRGLGADLAHLRINRRSPEGGPGGGQGRQASRPALQRDATAPAQGGGGAPGGGRAWRGTTRPRAGQSSC